MKMHQKNYIVRRHAYSDHLKSMMKELMMNEDFSDVTLVTEDKKHIKANINILKTCSPVFNDILKKEKNSNQIMYLRGVQFSEMESIMQFIYLGKATFYEERIDEFLAVAKSHEIKGLYSAENETNDVPPIVLAVSNAVAVAAFPVVSWLSVPTEIVVPDIDKPVPKSKNAVAPAESSQNII